MKYADRPLCYRRNSAVAITATFPVGNQPLVAFAGMARRASFNLSLNFGPFGGFVITQGIILY
jgi:hypothetical protein